MKLVLLLLGAIALIILGARGTYKAVWNQFFPNEPIVTTPVSTVGVVGTPQQQQQGVATNPNEAGQQAAKATQQIIKNVTNGGGTNAHVVPAKGSVNPVESVGRTQERVINTGIPDWWPSWLAWPGNLIGWYPGQGQTNQQVNNPWAP